MEKTHPKPRWLKMWTVRGHSCVKCC